MSPDTKRFWQAWLVGVAAGLAIAFCIVSWVHFFTT